MRAGVSAVLLAALAAGVPNRLPDALAQPRATTPAKELYTAAERAMAEGRYAAAATDYTKAYELSKEPTLFFKIASAHQKAGDCGTALGFYGRYLREGKPAEKFVTLTRQRIVECKGDPDALAAPPAPPAPAAPAEPAAPPEVIVEPAPAPAPAPTPPPAPIGKHQGEWLLVGGSIAMLTIGGVLAYSANAAENDVTDLYVGLDNRPPRFDDRTRDRYDELLAEGERYETLALVSFGVAGALAIGATVWFVRGRGSEPAPRVAPVLSPRNAGVVVRF